VSLIVAARINVSGDLRHVADRSVWSAVDRTAAVPRGRGA
jgi:hypothetical protein